MTVKALELCCTVTWCHTLAYLLKAALLFSGNEFRFASYYGEHMVLQKAPEKAVVWGYGTPGAEVQISLAGPQSEQVKSVYVLNGE